MKKITINGVEISKDKLKELAIEHGLMKPLNALNALYKHTNGALYVFTNECSGFGFETDGTFIKSDNKLKIQYVKFLHILTKMEKRIILIITISDAIPFGLNLKG